MGEIIDFVPREVQPNHDEEARKKLAELIDLQQACSQLRITIRNINNDIQQIDETLSDRVVNILDVTQRRKLPVERKSHQRFVEECLADLSGCLERINELYSLGCHSAYDGLECAGAPSIEYW